MNQIPLFGHTTLLPHLGISDFTLTVNIAWTHPHFLILQNLAQIKLSKLQ